jgi:hypothetical protein
MTFNDRELYEEVRGDPVTIVIVIINIMGLAAWVLGLAALFGVWP